MIRAAITGGAASGKTTVCSRLKELGVRVLSSDVLSREAVMPGSSAYQQIVAYFGNEILLPDGNLNRPALRHIIVSNETARKVLEGFIHPEVIRLMHQHFEKAHQAGEVVIMVEVPLLFEAGLERQFDTVVTICIDPSIQIQRLAQRDRISESQAQALIQIQMRTDEKIKRSEFVIENNGTPDELIQETDRFYRLFCEKYLSNKRKSLTDFPSSYNNVNH